jgi:hypothetical protein
MAHKKPGWRPGFFALVPVVTIASKAVLWEPLVYP